MAKAPPKKEEKKPEAAIEGEEQPPKKKGKLPLILGLVVLLAAAGGGAWFFLFKDKGAEAPQQQAKPKPPVFVPLDAFTVNLSAEQAEQYLQAAATLKVLDPSAADAAKLHMPEVRHRILTLLSSKKPSEITTGEGRERLAEEIRQTANNILLAAAGRPVKPIVLDVPRPAGEAPVAADAKQDSPSDAKPDAAAEAPKPAEGNPPQEGAAPADANATPATPAQAAPAATPAAKPATMLSRAAEDDPVQSVFFTSFIIQ
jgi:flagellar FliL protein